MENFENIQNQTFFQTPVGNTQNVETQNNSFFQVPLNSNPNMVPNDSMNSVSPMPSGQSPNSEKKKISMKDWILNHKKVILIVLGICIIGIGGFIVYNFFSSSTGVETLFDQNKPIKISKDGKYGYINTNGKVIINPTYDEASEFYGKFAIVKSKGQDKYGFDDLYQVIDSSGKVKASSEFSSQIEFDSEFNIWIINGQLYDGSMNKISSDNVEVDNEGYGYLTWKSKDGKSGGIMNSKGKTTYTYKFQSGESYISITPSDIVPTLKERYCVVNVEAEKYGIVNCDTGKFVVDFTENLISGRDDNIFEIYDKNYQSYEIYIQNNKVTYQGEHDDVSLQYYNGYIEIRDSEKDYNERYSYFDTKTGQISKTQPDDYISDSLSAWEILTGNIEKREGGKYGLINGDKTVLGYEWDNIDYFSVPLYQYLKSKGKDYVLAEKDEKTYLVDLKNGQSVKEFSTLDVYDSEMSPLLKYSERGTNETTIYNILNGKSMTTKKENSVYTGSNYITIEENDKTNYYNLDFKLIYTEEE